MRTTSEIVLRRRDPREGRNASGMRTSGSSAGDAQGTHRRGEVYLIGAGPGDPELLTLRAVRLLRAADVVVYDHLVSEEVLEYVPPGAERVYVGKERSNHTLPQEEINALLVALGSRGLRVARLKGGDPFVFGRGGEEAQALVLAGIPFQVVPGITAASGVTAAAGVPLTHRDHAHACVLVTGHLRDGTMDLDWAALARPKQTVVVYMGLKGLGVLCRELIAHGLPASTPAMIVEKGTTPQQRVVEGDLSTLPELAQRHRAASPTLIVVGDVVALRSVLAQGVGGGAAAAQAAQIRIS